VVRDAADRDLVADDGAARFADGRVAALAEALDERRLAGARPAGDDDEVLGHGESPAR
jgi:hypothetical protein